MIFLIATVFIAQIIILVNIVTWVISLDAKVKLLSAKIEQDNDKFQRRIVAIREITEGLKEILPNMDKKFRKKRNRFIFKWLKTFLRGTVLIFFKPKYKKVLLGLDLGLTVAKDLSKR